VARIAGSATGKFLKRILVRNGRRVEGRPVEAPAAETAESLR